MKILHVIPASPFGGAQKLTISIAMRQKAMGMDPWLGFLNYCEQASAFIGPDLQVLPRMTPQHRRIQQMIALRRALRFENFDIIHSHVPPPWLTSFFPRDRAFALVTHLHTRPAISVHKQTLRRRLESIGTQQLLQASDFLIAISNWVEAAWCEEYARVATPIRTIYNGLPIAQVDPMGVKFNRSQGFVVSIASRLSDNKGVEEFLELAAIIHRLAPDARFRIAGDGPRRVVFERRSRELGLDGILTFEGFVVDMPRFWANADICAFTAPFEPFGLRLIEPISYGVPIIAFLNGSGSDEVVSRCRGIHAVPYAQTEKLAQIAVSLGRTPAKRNALAKTGLEDLRQHFSIDVMVDQICEVYRSVLAAKHAYNRIDV